MKTEKYRDGKAAVEERVADLLGRMALEEKVGQMCQMDGSREPAEAWVTEYHAGSLLHVTGDRVRELQAVAAGTRLGIPLLFGIDAIHGHCFDPAGTVFPTQLSLSGSWNEELLEEVARVTASEVAASGLHWTFSPVLCLGRDPRWGRMSETFGEDPVLAGRFGAAMIRGYQGPEAGIDAEHILACAKHYVAYGETLGGRDSTEAEVSRRKLLSLFLPPFEEAARAGCASFMSGYQSIDGIPATAHSWLLRDVLCEEWNYDGFVVTDWDNVGNMVHLQKVCADLEQAAELAIQAGNHMIMNTPGFFQAALKGIESGRIPVELVDEAVRRILRQKFRLRLFDERRFPGGNRAEVLHCAEHRALALRAARESMVLLTNHRNTLPLPKNTVRLALIGANADDLAAQLADWSFGPHRPELDPANRLLHSESSTTLRRALEERSAEHFELRYHPGWDPAQPDQADPEGARRTAEGADFIILCLGDHPRVSGEGRDRADLDLGPAQRALFAELRKTGIPLVVVLITSKPLCLCPVADQADAILLAGNPGEAGGTAIAEVLFGDYNPHGKLTASWPRMTGQLPVYYNQLPGWHGGKYIDCPPDPLFPFGHGLSYSTFTCRDLRLSQPAITPDGELQVELTVRNNGPLTGSETIQLYVDDEVSSVVTPVRQLKDFQIVRLQPGASTTVVFRLRASQLWLINSSQQKSVEPGEFTVLVGLSSDPRQCLTGSFHVLPAPVHQDL